MSTVADLAPGLGYTDWRDEVLNMTGTAGRTYYGWRDGSGRRRAAVLRGTVMSPLRPAASGDDPAPVFSWGSSDPGAHLLAQALMADAVGAESRCVLCSGTRRDCPTCAGHGLQDWARELAGNFAHEVVSGFHPEGFELRVADVASWMDGRVRSPG